LPAEKKKKKKKKKPQNRAAKFAEMPNVGDGFIRHQISTSGMEKEAPVSEEVDRIDDRASRRIVYRDMREIRRDGRIPR
jgi:hypothetical protein